MLGFLIEISKVFVFFTFSNSPDLKKVFKIVPALAGFSERVHHLQIWAMSCNHERDHENHSGVSQNAIDFRD